MSLKEGHLLKRASNPLRGPNSRYFVLTSDSLSYYESHEAFKAEKPARGSIALSAQTKVVVPQKKGKTCGFVVSAPGGKEWHLSGETERDEEEWIEMIRGRKLVIKKAGSLVAVSADPSEACAPSKPAQVITDLSSPLAESDGPPGTIAVVGSSGSVGSAAVAALSAVPELRWMVRAVTRDPDAIAHLAAEGKVEVVQGDMADREGLEQRLQGAKYVFIVTPGSEDRVELTRNAVEATKAAGADFVVLISGTTVGLPSTRSGGQWQQIEAHLRGSELPYCVLRCPLFLENLLAHQSSIALDDAFYLPIGPTKPWSAIAISDVARAAVSVLCNPSQHVMKSYSIAAPPLTAQSLAEAFSAVLDRPITCKHVSYDQTRSSLLSRGFWEWSVDAQIETYRLIDADSPCGFVRKSDFQDITKAPAQTVEEWIEAHKDTFNIPPECASPSGVPGFFRASQRLASDANPSLSKAESSSQWGIVAGAFNFGVLKNGSGEQSKEEQLGSAEGKALARQGSGPNRSLQRMGTSRENGKAAVQKSASTVGGEGAAVTRSGSTVATDAVVPQEEGAPSGAVEGESEGSKEDVIATATATAAAADKEGEQQPTVSGAGEEAAQPQEVAAEWRERESPLGMEKVRRLSGPGAPPPLKFQDVLDKRQASMAPEKACCVVA